MVRFPMYVVRQDDAPPHSTVNIWYNLDNYFCNDPQLSAVIRNSEKQVCKSQLSV